MIVVNDSDGYFGVARFVASADVARPADERHIHIVKRERSQGEMIGVINLGEVRERLRTQLLSLAEETLIPRLSREPIEGSGEMRLIIREDRPLQFGAENKYWTSQRARSFAGGSGWDGRRSGR
jgi:hypothetical protein